MVSLQLNSQESELVRKILEAYLADLRVEIAGMEIEEFVAALRREEAVVEGLLPRFESAPTANRFGEYAQF